MIEGALAGTISKILTAAELKGVDVVRIDPVEDHGAAIVFAADDVYADIECLSTGEILAGTRDRRGMPHVWGIDSTGIDGAIDKIAGFLRGSTDE